MKGTELKKRRKRLGLGPVDLARALGVSYKTIWTWERDKRSIPEIAVKLLECLEKSNGLDRLGRKT